MGRTAMSIMVRMAAIAVVIGLATLPLVHHMTKGPKERATLKVEGNGVINCLAFSPDGKTLACGGGTVQVWDLVTLSVRSEFKGNSGNVLSVAFSPDGKTLGCAGRQANSTWGEIAFRNLASGERRGIVSEGPEEEI